MGPPYDHSVWKKLYDFDLKQTANITAKVYDANGKLFNTLIDGEEHENGYVEIDWPAVNMEGWHSGRGSANYTLEVTAEVNGEIVTKTIAFSFNYAHDFADHEKYRVQ